MATSTLISIRRELRGDLEKPMRERLFILLFSFVRAERFSCALHLFQFC